VELIEKLNCLEFESARLNRAYQLWRSYVEEGTAADWMVAVITVTYDALITFCLEVSTILADDPHTFSARDVGQLEAADCEIPAILEEESMIAEPEMPAAISSASNGEAIREPVIQPGQQDEEADAEQVFSARLLFQLKSAAFLEEESTIAEPSSELMPAMEPEMPATSSAPSTSEAIWEQ